MTSLSQLIEKLCPNGVPVSSLGEVVDFKRGSTITKANTTPGEIPVLSGGQKPAYFHGEANREGQSVVVAGSGAYAGFVTFWEQPVFVSDAFTVAPKDSHLLPKYVFYYLKSHQAAIHNFKTGSGIPHVYGKDLANMQIQVPPFEVQSEIVRILDEFTLLEAELEAELEARKKQYEHYRNELLSFKHLGQGGVRWVTLSEVGEFIRGNGLQKKDFQESGFPCIHYGQIFTHYGLSATETKSFVSAELAQKLRKAKTGDLVIATTSENTEDVAKAVAWLGPDKVVYGGHASVYRHSMHPAYVAHYFRSDNFQAQKNRLVRGTKVKDISNKALEGILIPVPDKREQERVADILDAFDALVNGMREGLPAEITARRKQYEYYREQLLTFDELVEA